MIVSNRAAEAQMDVGEIANLSLQCQRHFDNLCEAIVKTADADDLRIAGLQDELGRFRLWASDIGALNTGRASLDYRLRDVEYLYQNTKSLLEGLKGSLAEGLAPLKLS